MHWTDQKEFQIKVAELVEKFPMGYGDRSEKIPISHVRVLFLHNDFTNDKNQSVQKILNIGEFTLSELFIKSGAPAAHMRNWFDAAYAEHGDDIDEMLIEPVFKEVE